MLTIHRKVQLVLPGRPLAGVLMPSGDLAVACAREGEVLIGRFSVGTRGDGPRRSDKLLRLPSATPEAGRVALFMPPTGRDHPILVSGSVVLGIDARAMEPRWRLNLDGDGGGVAVLGPDRLWIADPPRRLTALDFEGHERESVELDGDVVGVAVGAARIAVTTARSVWRIASDLGVEKLAELGGPHVSVEVGRSGTASVLTPERLVQIAPGPAVEVTELGAMGGLALTLTPEGDPVVATASGVWVVRDGELVRQAEFVAAHACACLNSGTVVVLTPDNLLTWDGSSMEMLAFQDPRILVPCSHGAWIVGGAGQAVWAV